MTAFRVWEAELVTVCHSHFSRQKVRKACLAAAAAAGFWGPAILGPAAGDVSDGLPTRPGLAGVRGVVHPGHSGPVSWLPGSWGRVSRPLVRPFSALPPQADSERQGALRRILPSFAALRPVADALGGMRAAKWRRPCAGLAEARR